MDDKLQIPLSVELTKEAGWTQRDKYHYFIARYHLHIEDEQTDELGFGDILRTFHTTDFSETEVVRGFEEECTIADVKETTRSILLENGLTQNVTGTITGGAKSPLYELSANIGASLEQTIHSSVEQSIKSGYSVSTRVKKSFTISQKIKPGSNELQVAVAGYRKYSQKVFLHYIDYLAVEYKPTVLGLRKKKSNLPRPIGGKHTNRIPINMPLFKLFYWKLESESSLLYTETEYKQLPKVKHPDRITFEELNEGIRLPLPSKPDRPTLYTLSNIAFPLRWIDRKGPWTKDELEKIELNEAEGSAWWFQYGPGRNKT
jgi:hypothetical protein